MSGREGASHGNALVYINYMIEVSVYVESWLVIAVAGGVSLSKGPLILSVLVLFG